MRLIKTKDPELSKQTCIELFEVDDLKKVALMFGNTFVFIHEDKYMDVLYFVYQKVFYFVTVKTGGVNGTEI